MNSNDIRKAPPAPNGDDEMTTPVQAPGLTDVPSENVDQDGHCITPAYGESVSTNTGAPCDDGRDGS